MLKDNDHCTFFWTFYVLMHGRWLIEGSKNKIIWPSLQGWTELPPNLCLPGPWTGTFLGNKVFAVEKRRPYRIKVSILTMSRILIGTNGDRLGRQRQRVSNITVIQRTVSLTHQSQEEAKKDVFQNHCKYSPDYRLSFFFLMSRL